MARRIVAALAAAALLAGPASRPPRPRPRSTWSTAGTTAPLRVGGTYQVVTGQFGGDLATDIFFYGPGSRPTPSGSARPASGARPPSQESLVDRRRLPAGRRRLRRRRLRRHPLLRPRHGARLPLDLDRHPRPTSTRPGGSRSAAPTSPRSLRDYRAEGPRTTSSSSAPARPRTTTGTSPTSRRHRLLRPGTYSSRPLTVNGAYQLVVGDYSGDRIEDVILYQPGTGARLPLDQQPRRAPSPRRSSSRRHLPAGGESTGRSYDGIYWWANGGGAAPTGSATGPLRVTGTAAPPTTGTRARRRRRPFGLGGAVDPDRPAGTDGFFAGDRTERRVLPPGDAAPRPDHRAAARRQLRRRRRQLPRRALVRRRHRQATSSGTASRRDTWRGAAAPSAPGLPATRAKRHAGPRPLSGPGRRRPLAAHGDAGGRRPPGSGGGGRARRLGPFPGRVEEQGSWLRSRSAWGRPGAGPTGSTTSPWSPAAAPATPRTSTSSGRSTPSASSCRSWRRPWTAWSARPPRSPSASWAASASSPSRASGPATTTPSRCSPRSPGSADDAATARLQELYAEPIKPELIRDRIKEIRGGRRGVVRRHHAAAAAQAFADALLAAELDLLVIQGSVVSAEHVTKGGDPLNLKTFVRRFDLPVIVGGCASYQAALHLMRTGAAGILVGVGAGATSTTRAGPRRRRGPGHRHRRRPRRPHAPPRRDRRLRPPHRRRRHRAPAATSPRPSPAAPTRSCSARPLAAASRRARPGLALGPQRRPRRPAPVGTGWPRRPVGTLEEVLLGPGPPQRRSDQPGRRPPPDHGHLRLPHAQGAPEGRAHDHPGAPMTDRRPAPRQPSPRPAPSWSSTSAPSTPSSSPAASARRTSTARSCPTRSPPPSSPPAARPG